MKRKNIIILIIIIIFIDQISKMYSISIQTDNIVIIHGILQLNCTKNTGVAFGLANKNLISIIITDIIVISILLRFLIKQKENMNKITQISLAFILSGGISNLVDRIFKGGVIDFIDISLMIKYFPIFNIADVFIVLGFIMFVILSWINLMNLRKENMEEEEIDK